MTKLNKTKVRFYGGQGISCLPQSFLERRRKKITIGKLPPDISIGSRVEGNIGKKKKSAGFARSVGTGLVTLNLGYDRYQIKSDYDGALLTRKFREIKVITDNTISNKNSCENHEKEIETQLNSSLDLKSKKNTEQKAITNMQKYFKFFRSSPSSSSSSSSTTTFSNTVTAAMMRKEEKIKEENWKRYVEVRQKCTPEVKRRDYTSDSLWELSDDDVSSQNEQLQARNSDKK